MLASLQCYKILWLWKNCPQFSFAIFTKTISDDSEEILKYSQSFSFFLLALQHWLNSNRDREKKINKTDDNKSQRLKDSKVYHLTTVKGCRCRRYYKIGSARYSTGFLHHLKQHTHVQSFRAVINMKSLNGNDNRRPSSSVDFTH